MRSDIKFFFRGRCSREVLPFGQSDSETSFLQGHESGTPAGRSARRGDSESERISQTVSMTASPQQQVSNTITTRCDNDTQGVFPFNATPDGLARPIKAQYYKNGAANFLRADSFGATGVLCVDDLKE